MNDTPKLSSLPRADPTLVPRQSAPQLTPTTGFLLATLIGTFVYFFGFVDLFIKGTFFRGVCSTAEWAWQAWNPVANQEHSKLVPLISLGLVWFHRKRIREAAGPGSNRGLIFVGIGVLLFLLSARCLQPRIALAALPFLIYGCVVYLWGSKVGRVVLFPCAFLVFMIPFGAAEQATFRLQFIITGIVHFLAQVFGIQIQAVGTTLTALDGSFNFQIAEGCSGVRSLTAMTMLTAIYVHLTQNRLWKKATIICFSLFFAILGNVGRIFTVVLMARFVDPKFAAGMYHDYSGFIFFPFALAGMVAFSKLLNLRNRGPLDLKQREAPVSYDY